MSCICIYACISYHIQNPFGISFSKIYHIIGVTGFHLLFSASVFVFVFASVFVTDIWFVGSLFTQKQLRASNDTSESGMTVCRGMLSRNSAVLANSVYYLLYLNLIHKTQYILIHLI